MTTYSGCVWKYDETDDGWETECDNRHTFIDGGPEENDHKFCPYCGEHIQLEPKTQIGAGDIT